MGNLQRKRLDDKLFSLGLDVTDVKDNKIVIALITFLCQGTVMEFQAWTALGGPPIEYERRVRNKATSELGPASAKARLAMRIDLRRASCPPRSM